jgi:hypothetical protein
MMLSPPTRWAGEELAAREVLSGLGFLGQEGSWLFRQW